MTPSSAKHGPPAWIPFTLLTGAGLYLAKRWNDLPDRWIVHWGAGGVANGWTTRSVSGVFWPLVMGLTLWTTFEVAIGLVRMQARTKPETEAMVAATVPFFRWLSLAISFLLSYLSIELPLGHPNPHRIAVFALLLLLGSMAAGIAQASAGFARARREGAAPLPPGYHWAYYYDRDNPRLWVPKLSGLSATINFAHPMAWPMMLLMLGLPILAVVLAATTLAR